MTTYTDRRTAQLARAAAVQIEGVPLDATEQRLGREKWLVIGVCLCVQDTPEFPCPCDRLVVWVPDGSVLQTDDTDRRTASGAEIKRYTIQRGAKVVLEAPLRVSVDGLAALRKLKAGAPGAIAPAGGTTDGRSVARRPSLPGPVGQVVGAFIAGYEFGEWLDGELGLSDAISDWLVDVLD
jgi:hypothetical protein